jgi:chromosome segregation ATPase
MALLLAIASLLSAAIGWLARRFFHEKHLLERRSDEQRRARIPAQLRDSLARANHDLDSAEAEVHSLRNALGDKKGQLEALEQALQNKNKDAADAEQNRIKLLAELEQLKGKDAELQRVAAERAKLESDLAAANAALNEAKHAGANKDGELRAAASTNANLEDIISSLKDDIAQKTAALERANEKEASLAREIARLEKQLADKDQAHTMRAGDLEKQIRDEQAQVNRAQQAIAAGEEKLRSLDTVAQERAAERDKLEKQCADQQSEIARLQRELDRQTQQAAEARRQQDKKLGDLEHALDKQKTLAAQAEQQRRKEADLSGKLQADMDKLQRQFDASNSAEAARGAQLDNLLQEQQRMAEAANAAQTALNDKYNDLRQERDALKNETAQAKRALHDADTGAARLTEKNAAAEQRIAELEAGMGKLEQAGAGQLKGLQQELAASQEAMRGKDNDLKDALTQLGDLREKLAQMSASDADLRAKIERLEMLLAEQRKHAGRSLQSRILELEAMLDAEQRRADELPEIPMVTRVKQTTKAANASTVSSTGKVAGS